MWKLVAVRSSPKFISLQATSTTFSTTIILYKVPMHFIYTNLEIDPTWHFNKITFITTHVTNYLVVWLSEVFVCWFVLGGFFGGIIKLFLEGRTILTKKSKHIFSHSLDLTGIQNVLEICERKSPCKLKRGMNANAHKNSHSLHMPTHTHSLVYVIKNSAKDLGRFCLLKMISNKKLVIIFRCTFSNVLLHPRMASGRSAELSFTSVNLHVNQILHSHSGNQNIH